MAKTRTRRNDGNAPGIVTKQGFVSANVPDLTKIDAEDYVVVELRYEAPVGFTPTKFAGPAEAELKVNTLNDVLARHDIAALRPHFPKATRTVKERVAIAGTLPHEPEPAKFAKKGLDADFIHSGFLEVHPKRGKDAHKIAEELNRKDPVWQAFVAPRPVPAGLSGSAVGTRNFEPAQGYLCDPPNGVGAMEVWPLPGARGEKITICDIEGNWNRRHEDLPRGIPLLGGTVINDIGWRNHGTAVLGEMVSLSNGFGTVGICHRAKAAVHSAVINNVFNTAGAIAGAAAVLKAGDAILIELQAIGPNNKYVAMQYWDDVYSAIKAATQKGITVVEAAGNGNENFDLAIFTNTGLQKDSGAIIVGAGVPPTNRIDIGGWPNPAISGYGSLGVPRSRIWFSNYGKMVNVQGWGWHVTTLGYGDLQGDASENKWYTLRFSGTSSASPIVTGCVACIQGRAKALNGSPLPPAKVREILIKTGTPQEPGPGVPVSQRIGPLPNLVKAMTLI